MDENKSIRGVGLGPGWCPAQRHSNILKKRPPVRSPFPAVMPMTATDTITILGIDPSMTTGWALLSVEGQCESVLEYGIHMASDQPHDLRLRALYLWLRGIIKVHRPGLMAIETPFYRLNAKTLVTLAQIGAALRLAATMEMCPIVEIAPAERCTALGLSGNATKQQLLFAVNAVYNLNLNDHNEADAVAIAAAAAVKRRQKQMKICL